MIFPGGFNVGHAIKIKGMHVDPSADHKVVYGTFMDSVDINPSETLLSMVYGGTPLVHNSFISVLDASGNLMYGFGLGNSSDSVTITTAFLDGSDYIAIAGNFSGTVNFNPLGGTSNLTSVSSNDAFYAVYDFSGNLDHVKQYSPSAGSMMKPTCIGKENSNSSYYLTGYFDGNIDLNPTGAPVNLSTTGGKDGFVVHYSASGTYLEHGQMGGTGDAMPTEIMVDDFFTAFIGGTFTGTLNLEISGGTYNINSNGGKDVFYGSYGSGFAFSSGDEIKLGGSSDDVLKDMFVDLGIGQVMFLIDYQGSINLDPDGSAIVTSEGGTDVAYAKFNLTPGSPYICSGSFGNSGNNSGFGIYGKPFFGGLKSMAANGFAITLNFTGTMDFDPNPANILNSTATNTTINAAIIDLDSIGGLIYHGIIEATDIKGYHLNTTLGPNMVTMVGNYNGTNVEILPYLNSSVISGTSNGGFFAMYNRCHITSSEGAKLLDAYECGTATAQMKCDVDLGTYAEPLSYFWSNGDFIDYNYIASGAYEDPNFYFIYITDAFGCVYQDSLKIIGHIDYTGGFELSAGAIITPTVCGENYGSALATYTNAVLPVNYYWSNGDTTVTADSLISGNYFLRVTDSLGCYYQAYFNIYNSDGPAITLTDLQNPTCHGSSDGLIDITLSGGVAPYDIEWTNGTTSEDQAGLPAGTYTVIVTDAAGCTNIVCYDLAQPDFIGIFQNTTINSDCGLSTGVLHVGAYGGLPPYTFQWGPSAFSSIGDSIFNIPAGIHTVTVTDGNGCTATATYGISDNLGPFSFAANSANPVCTVGNGFIDVETFGSSPFTYEWKTGETTQDLNSLSEGGLYQLLTTDLLNCKTFTEFFLSEIVPASPPVCLAGVDSSGLQNVVVWDESFTPEADYYKIYREGFCNSAEFGHVGTVQQEDLSVFYDTVVNTDTRSWRYYVTAVDTCGNESFPSEIHRTVHLTSMLDANNDAFLQWDAYVGQVIGQYKIFRLLPSGTAYTLVDSVDAFTFEYLDTASFAGYDSLLYYVEAVPESICLAAKAYNQNAARSNTARMMAPLDTTGSSINTIILEEKLVKVFPNPAQNLVTLQVNALESNWNLVMMDAFGRVRKQFHMTQNQITLPVSDLSPGVYFIQLNSTDGKFKSTKRLLITR